MGNRSHSKRKRRRIDTRPPDPFQSVESISNWRFTTWDQDCGHPRLTELIGAWMFVAPMLFICLAITVSGIVSAPFGLLFGVPAAAIGYFVFWRPMWRLQQRYLMFDEDGMRRRPATRRETNDDGDRWADAPEADAPESREPLVPHTAACEQAIDACLAAIEISCEERNANPKEHARYEQLLHSIVQQAMEGQIELLDACEVGRHPHRLIYMVVNYRHEYSSGKSRYSEQRVGQLVLLTLPVDLGRLWIRPETLPDKLLTWWSDEDLDFADHPQFSRRYYCQTDDPTRVQLRVPDRVWQAIGEHDALVVRAAGMQAVVAKEEQLRPEHAVELVQLGFEILEAFAAANVVERFVNDDDENFSRQAEAT
jgi:hypothetical protein